MWRDYLILNGQAAPTFLFSRVPIGFNMGKESTGLCEGSYYLGQKYVLCRNVSFYVIFVYLDLCFVKMLVNIYEMQCLNLICCILFCFVYKEFANVFFYK